MYVNERFELVDTTYRSVIPNWGYGAFSEFIYYSNYSRRLMIDDVDYGQETWPDTIERVINGVMSIRKDWYIRNHIKFDNPYWQDYAARMAVSLAKMEWSPPGRGLWAMGTDLIYERGSMALYNCAWTNVGSEWIDDLCWLMDCLMHGVGVGFGPIRTGLKLYEPSTVSHYQIPDTREGWVASVRLRLRSYCGGPYAQFDYSQIRPSGTLIKTFGGVASGPEPLVRLHEIIDDLCIMYIRGELDEIVFKCDLANVIGVQTITGNTRRGAEIAICGVHEPVFGELKDYAKYPHRRGWGWMSNNSFRLTESIDFDYLPLIAQSAVWGHDVGFVNARNMRHGRIGKFDSVPTDLAIGLNPCLPAWAKVLTPSGIRELDDVDEGDLIWSETGWTEIESKWSTGYNDVYSYDTQAGVLFCTKDHQVVSDCFKVEAQYADTIDLLTGRVEVVDHDPQDVMDGLLIGDGSNQNGVILLNIGDDDQSYFQSEVQSLIGSVYSKPKCRKAITQLSPSEVAKHLVPEVYQFANSRRVAGFLRGLFSANGCVINEQRISLKTVQIELVRQVQLMLSSLGIRSYYTTNAPKMVRFENGDYVCRRSYDVSITVDRCAFQRLIGFIQPYKTEALEQYCQRSKKANSKGTYEVVATEYVSTEETFDIKVKNSTHTFWCNGFNISNCGEVPLEHREVCNLAETCPTKCVDHEQWLEACGYATMYCSTVTLLPTHQPSTNAVVNRNRRIGVSIVDYIGWKELEGVTTITRCLRDGYARVRSVNESCANEAGVPPSIRVTTVKPGGTVPKMFGRLSGVSHPTFPYMIRRVNVRKGTPIESILMAAGVPSEESAYTPETTIVFEFPLCVNHVAPATDVTIWEQAMNVVLLQREWADNAVSNTLYFKPKWLLVAEGAIGIENEALKKMTQWFIFVNNEQWVWERYNDGDSPIMMGAHKVEYNHTNGSYKVYQYNPHHEEDQVEAVLSSIAPLTKSVSLLPHSTVGIYKQMPEEGITREEYEKRVAAIKEIDWSTFTGDGQDEKYCSGDTCTIRG